ncbi:ABC transporter substrate-binding protein [Acetobacter aceti]|uniref:ABC transporter substrate-binding protein n=1 Tax=Acetobacter aceti TaxID=435 RepID=A0A6S6PI22_ACEAC|nr:ABC transporter substrate-binding protein [Acetobacter aceti]BCI66345.1 ABC transporter substrate-binding protein [Acetobacter aceti]
MNIAVKRRAAIAGCLTALLLASPAEAQPLRKVVVSQLFQGIMFLPLYVAMDHGFFEAQGLAVTKQTAGSPNAALSAVISGSAQFSLHGPEWTAVAAAKGADVQVIGGVVNRAAVWIVAAPGVNYTGPKDLAGHVVSTGMMPIASTSLFTKLLADDGVDPSASNITVKQVQAGSELGPLLAGQSDVAVLYQPALEQAVAKGFKVIVSFPQVYGPYLLSAISARKSVDPDTAERFIGGLQQALQFMQANPQEATDIAKKEFPTIEPAIVEAAVKRMIDEKVYATSVAISHASFSTAMATQVTLGNLKNQPVYQDLVATSIIDGAIKRAGSPGQ